MSNLWSRLRDAWRVEGLVVRPGAGADAIDSFEKTYDVVVPGDLRAFWMTVDGMDENDLDSDLNRFWSVGEIKPVFDVLSEIHPDRWAYPDCYVFADHCMWCFGWAVKLGRHSADRSGPVYQVTGGDKPGREVAGSFTAFVEMYLADPRSVL